MRATKSGLAPPPRHRQVRGRRGVPSRSRVPPKPYGLSGASSRTDANRAGWSTSSCRSTPQPVECQPPPGRVPRVPGSRRSSYRRVATMYVSPVSNIRTRIARRRARRTLGHHRCARRERPGHRDAEIPAGLRLATSLWAFWLGCGLQREGRYFLDRLLAADTRRGADRVPALWVAGNLASADGDIPQCLALLDECEQLAHRFSDAASIARATCFRGVAEQFAGQQEQAIAHLFHSWALVYLGLTALVAGRVPDAAAYCTEALTRTRPVGGLLGIGLAVEFLAWTAITYDDAVRGATLLGLSIRLAEPFGRPSHGSSPPAGTARPIRSTRPRPPRRAGIRKDLTGTGTSCPPRRACPMHCRNRPPRRPRWRTVPAQHR
jgi:hypothetical protein